MGAEEGDMLTCWLSVDEIEAGSGFVVVGWLAEDCGLAAIR